MGNIAIFAQTIVTFAPSLQVKTTSKYKMQHFEIKFC